MEAFIKFLLGVLVGVIVTIISVIFSFSKVTAPTPISPDQAYGSNTGGDGLSQQYFRAGVINGGLIATTSQGTAITLTPGEFKGWLNASEVSYTPIGLAALTITLPASTTLKGVLQNAGDMQRFCFRSATTTADVRVVFAGGTGTNLVVASSTATALGSAVVFSGKVACFTAVRQAYTAASFDIDVMMTSFQ